jgi:hypothetical protein
MIAPVFETTTQSTVDGTWSIDVPETVPNGIHRVQAVDLYGQTDEALLFIDRQTASQAQTPTLIERARSNDVVHTLIPPAFAYAIFFFLLLIIALSLNMIRLGRIADAEHKRVQLRQSRYTRHAIGLSVLAILAAFLMGILVNRSTIKRAETVQTTETYYLTVEGTVITPFTGSGVEGVDLVADDVRIHTDTSGVYRFARVSTTSGARLTHPSLTRAWRKLFVPETSTAPKAYSSVIHFDPALFNAAARVAELEARGDLQSIYRESAPTLQSSMTFDAFKAAYRPFYQSADLTGQELILLKTNATPLWESPTLHQNIGRVVELLLQNHNVSQSFFFTSTPEGWKLIF